MSTPIPYDYTLSNNTADLAQQYHDNPAPAPRFFYPEVEQETAFGPILAPSIYGKHLDSLQIAADGKILVKPDSREDSFLEFNNVDESMVITSYANSTKDSNADIQIISSNVDIDAGASLTADATTFMSLTAAAGAMTVQASGGDAVFASTDSNVDIDAGSNVTIDANNDMIMKSTTGDISLFADKGTNKSVNVGSETTPSDLNVWGLMTFKEDVTIGSDYSDPKTLKIFGDIELTGVINSVEVTYNTLDVKDAQIKIASGVNLDNDGAGDGNRNRVASLEG